MTKSFFSLLLTFVYGISIGQGNPGDDLPPDPGITTMTVTKVQDMFFGAFSVSSSGGSVTLSNNGMRTATGGVTLLSMAAAYYQAIFDIEVQENTIISVTNGPQATLTGSNGGTIKLNLGNCSPGSPFTTTAVPPARTALNIGGTLTIGTSTNSPPGHYTGTFEVYLDYQ